MDGDSDHSSDKALTLDHGRGPVGQVEGLVAQQLAADSEARRLRDALASATAAAAAAEARAERAAAARAGGSGDPTAAAAAVAAAEELRATRERVGELERDKEGLWRLVEDLTTRFGPAPARPGPDVFGNGGGGAVGRVSGGV